MFVIIFITGSMFVSNVFGMKKARAKKAVRQTTITLVQGDITRQEFDNPKFSAIVNAANEQLIGGAGVAAAIQNAGGPELMAALRAIETEVVNGIRVRCKVGGTALTKSFAMLQRNNNTRVDWIIHAVGPDLTGRINRSWPVEFQQTRKKKILRMVYRNILARARATGITNIAFPSISTNIFGYNINQATPVAIQTVLGFIAEHDDFEEIRFVVLGREAYDCYRNVLDRLVARGELEEQRDEKNPAGRNAYRKRTYNIVA